ncbi:hypothetical protein [uncultured Aquimarina sp.]|uniref:hypothetical protein n=1 Tax=uncultured Aquimarina sp. TaxID=575652 RepID=UPI0026191770|nr:hypothetical protein [uncultured Aquimarina sp.]
MKLLKLKNIRFQTLLFIALIAGLLGACSIGEKGVFYSEMSEKPELNIVNESLIIKTKNSSENSALLIYEVNAVADNESKAINLTATQALNKEFKEVFEIDLSKFSIDNINLWTINWVDPDRKKTKLELKD